MGTNDNIYSVNGSRTDCIKIARQLGYSDEVIQKLEKSKSDIERSQIMADARKEGRLSYKTKHPKFSGYAVVVEDGRKETQKKKEEEYRQITWRRK